MGKTPSRARILYCECVFFAFTAFTHACSSLKISPLRVNHKTGTPSLFGEGKNAFAFTRNTLIDSKMKHKVKE